MTTAVASNANSFTLLNKASSSVQTSNEAGSEERFLKLLVSQLENQDPLNPMDNAEMTSQIAQINTVKGVEKLNTTVEGLTNQYLQTQAVTGAALVGRDVTLQGNLMDIRDGVGVAGFELNGTAGNVRIEVLNPSGRVVDTLNLGAQGAGRHSFEWNAEGVADGSAHRFRILANNGTLAVGSTPLMRDRVLAVSTSGTSLVVDTARNGTVPYRDVKAFN